jgi:gamma-glutamyltranspeptidase/glutathione hydrolase
MQLILRWLIIAVLLAGCTASQPLPRPEAQAPSIGQAALAVPDIFAADVAEAVLRDGGSAVDAAVAVAFSLAVTYPEAGNIGGGGFMLMFVDGEAGFLDYRETAPASATRDMYLDAGGEVIDELSLVGHKAAGVPGTVAGMWTAHRRYGRLPWSRLLEPAIRLADEGFVAPAQLAQRIAEEAEWFGERTNFREYYGRAAGGARFRQPELAATLRRVADQGPAGFYEGVTAELVVAEMQRGGGLISAADLAGYAPVWREPLEAPWRQYRVLSAPPPSSGGFGVIQLLKMKDVLAADFAGLEHNSPQYIHLVAEMEKRVFADRAEYLGDPDFVAVPIAELVDEDYIASRARAVDREAISKLAESAPGLEGRHTTHFSILDRDGNAVSNTYTLNTWFGSGVVVKGAGFLLNNEMDDFSVKPGVPNFYGVVGDSANAVQPGKRMLSSMSPTILLEGRRVDMVVGTPGGSTIFTSVFQTIVNILDFGMSPQQAVAATRFHHQLLPPDLVTYSPGRPLAEPTIRALALRGYRAEPHAWDFGDVQVLWRDGDVYRGGSDPRGRGVSRVID